MTPQSESFVSALLSTNSDADITAAHAALPALTVRPIPKNELVALLEASGVIRNVRIAIASSQDVAVRASLQSVLDLRDGPYSTIDATDQRFARAVTETLASLSAANLIDQDTVTAIYQLGGGLKYQPITEADVALLRAKTVAFGVANARRNAVMIDTNTRFAQIDQFVEQAMAATSVGQIPSVPW